MQLPAKRIMIDGQLVINPAYFAARNAELAATAPVQTVRRVRGAQKTAERMTDETGEVAAPSSAERVRTWRAANPAKVRAAAARNNATRTAKRAAHEAALALPAGTACGVCGTVEGVKRDNLRHGALCRVCSNAVRSVETARRADTHRESITQYLDRAPAR